MKKNKALLASFLLSAAVLAGCAGTETAKSETTETQTAETQMTETQAEEPETEAAETEAKEPEAPGERRQLELLYADQFSVEYDEQGRAWIDVADGNRYVTVPEGAEVPEDLEAEVTVIRQPVEHAYLAASSAMDLICGIGGLDQVTLSGQEASGWQIEEAREAMEQGTLVYAGKYSAPDYEMLLEESCGLAIESTMIYRAPEVQEQLERLGIPVFTERSSYESHPLGRMEWMKLYGVLLGLEDEAEQCFARELEKLEPVMGQASTGKTAAFFYIGEGGYVNVRMPDDYIPKIISMAGGQYVPSDLDPDAGSSTMNMEMEAFYEAAKDADYLIYSGTIEGELESLEQFLDKSSILKEFKAVQEGNVWCTGKKMFQETMGLGDLILDLNRMFTEEEPDPRQMVYLRHLQ